MSGIAGILAESRPDRALLEGMAHGLAERGGTGADPWLDEHAALVRISDRAAPQSPFPLCSQDGRLVLVADGVLLNAEELHRDLAPRHEDRIGGAAGASNWNVVLTAFRLHGADFVHLLQGDFALALWDREAGTLLLARDWPGARPLCFARTPFGLAFASQARGLLPALGGAAIEPRALARFVQSGFVAGNLTLFAGIEQVPPGTTVTFTLDGSVVRGAARAPAKARRAGDAESAQECAALIRRTLDDTRPYGLLLDGAPSALLLALAGNEAAPQRVWLIREKSALSAPSADRDSENVDGLLPPGIARETVAVDAADLIWRLPEAAWVCEEPIWDPRLPALLALAEAAAGYNEWLLCADGAAETLGCAPRYHRPRLHRWMDRLLHPESGGQPGPGFFHGQERQLFGPRLHRAAVDWREPWELAWSSRGEQAEITRLQALDIELRIPGRILAALDRIGTVHGVRMRAPWLDARMIDFGLSLPERLKSPRGGGYLQRRVRESLAGSAIPPSLPSVPLSAWLTGATLDRFEQILSATPALRYWFQPETVRELVTMKRHGKRVTARLGTLLMFALWHRIWIEGDGERPPRCDPLEFLGSGGL